MTAASPFEWLCDELEARTSLKRIEARGTVRLTLKEAGFSPKGISAPELKVVVRKLLVRELEARRVEGAEEVCISLAAEMPMSVAVESTKKQAETAMSIFGRLGRMRGN